jgi:membrane-associated protease RseP (regulator of RpoE activity)|tara:strand:+ start:1173 stop:2729 length:1557 start_codon:yes stop_codon:yes gene_type:complete
MGVHVESLGRTIINFVRTFVKIQGEGVFGSSMDGAWGSVEADWKVVFLLILVWYVLLRIWEKNGVLDRWNASRVFGVVLMVRSSKGLTTLDYVAKPRRFWRIYGEVALWVCLFSMFFVAIGMLLAFVTSILSPPTAAPPSASELVAIPGLNPMIPLGWGAMAFIIALVIHEFGHGLLARAHGMRIRAFGLLQLGPLPLGAFAEPQYQELHKAPRKERMRMFAAGPATNIFAAIVCLLLLGGLAANLTTTNVNPHVQGIVKDSGADQAGLQPWDTILRIDGTEIEGIDGFQSVMGQYKANDTILVDVLHEDGSLETMDITLADKYQYYLDLGWSKEILENQNPPIEEGDAFVGIVGISEGTQGIDRLAGPTSPRFEGGFALRVIYTPFHILNMMIVPFEMQGISMHPMEESMLTPTDGFLGDVLGISGLLFLVNFFFWLMWVNILLGFTNLIPMVPFDGGHLFKDWLTGTLNRIRRIGNKTKLWKIHPMWVDHISRKASNMSSLALLMMVLFVLIVPYF